MELFKMASELSNVAWISASGKVQIFFNQSLEQKKMVESAPLGYDFNSIKVVHVVIVQLQKFIFHVGSNIWERKFEFHAFLLSSLEKMENC